MHLEEIEMKTYSVYYATHTQSMHLKLESDCCQSTYGLETLQHCCMSQQLIHCDTLLGIASKGRKCSFAQELNKEVYYISSCIFPASHLFLYTDYLSIGPVIIYGGGKGGWGALII